MHNASELAGFQTWNERAGSLIVAVFGWELATFTHPGHVVFLCSRDFAHLPPRINFKSIGYNPSKG